LSTAGCVGTTCPKLRITHPFHPLAGHEFDLICRRLHWGEDRVVYAGPDGGLHSIAASLTDVDPPDEFRRMADGGAAFRAVDLLELSALLERIRGPSGAGDA
jgi:Family of unknown function (DUF5372)